MAVDQQTLNDLEFHHIQDWLANYAQNESAKAKLQQILPSNNLVKIEKELNQIEELIRIKQGKYTFPHLDYKELKKEIKQLAIENAVLNSESFLPIAQASQLINAYLSFFEQHPNQFIQLEQILNSCYFTEELIQIIYKVFEENGQIKDDATPTLLEIRTKIKQVRQQINRNFEKEVRKLIKDNVLSDTKESFVSDRRVLSIQSTYKRTIKGIVHGSSKNGHITYVEPAINIPLNNEIEILKDDERKEIYLILKKLTKEIASYLPLIKAYQFVLVVFDMIHAKAKFAQEINAIKPALNNNNSINFIKAYHPLLLKNNNLLKKPTIPQHLSLNNEQKFIVISGPNAGGKSITLKTYGLLQIMLQAGLLIPVDPKSEAYVFENIYSDIGDKQSIENELSTYSYKLKRMHFFLKNSTANTLLLLDEFGTGSDPDLGGALAEVFFEELYKIACFGVITTHYSNIKLKAHELPLAINGCMLFDSKTLNPLYKFELGQPGSSFTFEVAKINGINAELINKAKQKINGKKVHLEKLLSDLQYQKNYLKNLAKEHIEAQKIAQDTRNHFQNTTKEAEEKIKRANAQLIDNSKFIQYGQKLEQFIEKFQLTKSKKPINQELLIQVQNFLSLEKNKRTIKKKAILKPVKAKEPKLKEQHKQHLIKIGSKVKMIENKQVGIVEDIHESTCTVIFGQLKIKVNKLKLSFIE